MSVTFILDSTIHSQTCIKRSPVLRGHLGELLNSLCQKLVQLLLAQIVNFEVPFYLFIYISVKFH